MRIEILDKHQKVVSSFQIKKTLTTIGQSKNADIQLVGNGIGPIHLAIEIEDHTKPPVLMDLGGPSAIYVDGKQTIEKNLESTITTVQIGDRQFQIRKTKIAFQELQKQKWTPISDPAYATVENIRVRLYKSKIPQDVQTKTDEYYIPAQYGIAKDWRAIWKNKKENKYYVQLPTEWLSLGGRIQAGKDKILKLEEWKNPSVLEKNTIYKVMAGPYAFEILISDGTAIISRPKVRGIPQELRKPLLISTTTILALFATWFLLFGRPDGKVEEPYEVYARIKNIPVERIPEPEPNATATPGGGGGSSSSEASAPVKGEKPKLSISSQLAQSLTGGLKNLIGNTIAKSKNQVSAVVSQTGVSSIAIAQGGTGPTNTGKITSIGSTSQNGLQGAAKLGKLAMKGSGKGFQGGSGAGLGKGSGFGIGGGVGNGIGQGQYKLIEEESIVEGGLDKEVIEAVIRNNLSQIKYCYERQLVAHPDLFGKVIVNWSIVASGSVQGSMVKRTTLHSSAVEQCMVSKISRWTFPQPKNGVKVSVTYPFLFKSTK